MRLLAFLVVTFFATASYTQSSISYGLPYIEKELHEGDLVIINTPTHFNGRFEQSVELSELKTFFQFHSGETFVLYIHVFGGSPEYCQDYSEFLSRDLRGQLNCKNIMIEGKGSTAPLFLDKESPRYFILNSRIEVVVGGKSDP